MKKTIIALSLLLVVFAYGCARGGGHADSLVSAIQGQAAGGNVGVNQGNLAPDFNIRTVDGKSINLRKYTDDKPTVVYFFATWCPHCRNDLAAVSNIYSQYSDKVNFLAIGLDNRESEGVISNYQQRMNLGNVDFALGNNQVLRDYNVVYTTTKYMIGKGGVILNKGTGEVNEHTWGQIFQAMAQ
jgi:thiol-disulfide isomerase/thioredoxin